MMQSSAQENLLHIAPFWSEDQRRPDDQARVIHAAMQQLAEQRISLLRRRNSLAPVNILPVECLSIVFRWAQRMEIGALSYMCHLQYEGRVALAVSQVCSRWRAVALETSCLWAKMALVVGDVTTPLGDGSTSFRRKAFETEMLNHRLQAPAYLDLDVQCASTQRREEWYQRDDPVMKASLDIIAPYFMKCRRLCLHNEPTTRSDRAMVSARLPVAMPQLESLLLWGYETAWSNGKDSPTMSMPWVGSHFKSLELHCVALRDMRAATLATLSTLRLFRASMAVCPAEPAPPHDETAKQLSNTWQGDGPDSNSVEDGSSSSLVGLDLVVLRSCTTLHTLELRDMKLLIHDNPEQVMLSTLDRLDLALAPPVVHVHNLQPGGEDSVVNIFRFVVMPALRTCTLDGGSIVLQDWEDALTALANARPPLVELTLVNPPSRNAGVYPDLLAALPLLEKLKLVMANLPAAVLQGLQVHDDASITLVPRLRFLQLKYVLNYCRDEEDPSVETTFFEELHKLVQSRFESTRVTGIDELDVVCLSAEWEWARQHLATLHPWVGALTVRCARSERGTSDELESDSDNSFNSDSVSTEVEEAVLEIPLYEED